MALKSDYLDLTSELLQDLMNLYTNDNQIFTYTFKRDEINTEEVTNSSLTDRFVSYQVTMSNPTKQNPIPSIVYYIRVLFKVPASKVLKSLATISFMQHVQFVVEHRKEPFNVALSIEEGLMCSNREAIKQDFDLIALLNQFMGREINPALKR